MRRFKVWVCFAANVLLLVAVAEPALAKRKRPVKPAADAVPATEVEPDASGRTAAPPGDSPGESPPDKERTAEKAAPLPPAPPPSEVPPPRRAPEPVAAVTSSASSPPASASRLSGHVGVGSPLVTVRATRSARRVSSVSDELTLIAPIGLGLHISDAWTFDFEFQVSTGVRPEGLTTVIVDPGLIYTWDRLSAGLRVAFQTNANQNIGLTPLMRLAILRNTSASWFVEASIPAFVQNKQVTAAAALQTGVTF